MSKFTRGARRPLMNGREFAFQRVLLSLGLEEAARGVFRDVVELTVGALAQIGRTQTHLPAALMNVSIVIGMMRLIVFFKPLRAAKDLWRFRQRRL